jgi:predicted transcriptional regulator
MIDLFKDMIDVRASYSPVEIVKILFLLSEKPMGRLRLMKEMRMGEATVKTLLKRLKDKDLIKSSTKGNLLTKKGKVLVRKILEKISKPIEITVDEYSVGKYNTAILVKNSSKKIKSGIEQRDEAIKIGASGATTLICRDGKLVFPGCNKDVSELEKIFREKIKIENDDVIIIGSASDRKKSEDACIAVALSLIEN